MRGCDRAPRRDLSLCHQGCLQQGQHGKRQKHIAGLVAGYCNRPQRGYRCTDAHAGAHSRADARRRPYADTRAAADSRPDAGWRKADAGESEILKIPPIP